MDGVHVICNTLAPPKTSNANANSSCKEIT